MLFLGRYNLVRLSLEIHVIKRYLGGNIFFKINMSQKEKPALVVTVRAYQYYTYILYFRENVNGLDGFRWRDWCGLHPIHNWDDLLGLMPNKSVKNYASIYAAPEDIDLWTAGITEKPLPGDLLANCPFCVCQERIFFGEIWFQMRYDHSAFFRGPTPPPPHCIYLKGLSGEN
jgi:hypothetical protein